MAAAMGEAITPLLGEAAIRAMAVDGTIPRSISSGEEVNRSELRSLLDQILVTARAAWLGHGHRAAALNYLSTLIAHISKNAELASALLWQGRVWVDAFNIFLDHFEQCKPKPMKQLLGTLLSSLKRQTELVDTCDSLSWLRLQLRGIFKPATPHRPSKAILHTLTAVLSRGLFNTSELTSGPLTDEKSPAPFDCTPLRLMLDRLLPLANHDDLGPTLATLIPAVISDFKSHYSPPSSYGAFNDEAVSAIVTDAVVYHYEDHPVLKSNYRHYLLPSIVDSDKRIFLELLSKLGAYSLFMVDDTSPVPLAQLSLNTADLLISSLIVGCSSALIKLSADVQRATQTSVSKLIELPLRTIATLLYHPNKILRAGVFDMLVDDSTINTPFTAAVLKTILQAMPSLLADVDSEFRSDFFGTFNRLVNRLRSSSAILLKKNQVLLADYTTFISKLVAILQSDLRPTANYQRHISALSCLHILVKSGLDAQVNSRYWAKSAVGRSEFAIQQEILSPRLVDCLAGLVADPFEDVRAMSTTLLGMMLSSGNATIEVLGEYRHTPSERLSSLIKPLEICVSRSTRTDQIDGLARLYSAGNDSGLPTTTGTVSQTTGQSMFHSLLRRCESSLVTLKASLSGGIYDPLLLANFVGLRYIVESPTFPSTYLDGQPQLQQTLIARFIAVYSDAWLAVRPILCDDAPEGYQPGVSVVAGEDDSSVTKSLLSFCWRTLKEISLLQRSLIVVLQSHTDLAAREHLHAAVELSFTQLAELRHRGAFSTVAQTFALCCSRLAQEVSDNQQELNVLYERVLRTIQSTTTINTRRSAGLPAMLTGIVAGPPDSSPLLKLAFGDLIKIATAEFRHPVQDHQALPQVHALNCLRELFRHSKLGRLSEDFAPPVLKLSGDCLRSDLWGVRNAGLMLFRAVLDRLIGTNEAYNEDDSRGSNPDLFGRYPILLDLVLDLMRHVKLDNDESLATQEQVFPALQLLERLPAPERHIAEVITAVESLCSSPQWHIRDKAARVLALLSPNIDLSKHEVVLGSARTSSNFLHGHVLYLNYVARNSSDTSLPPLDTLLNTFVPTLDLGIPDTIKGAMIDLILERKRSVLPEDVAKDSSNAEGWDSLQSWLQRSLESSLDPGKRRLESSSLTVALAKSMILQPPNKATQWPSLIEGLIRIDADAVANLLEECHHVVSSMGSTSSDTVMESIAAVALAVIEHADVLSSHVVTPALTLLNEVLTAQSGNLYAHVESRLPTISQLVMLSLTPLTRDAVLCLAAGILSRRLKVNPTVTAQDLADLGSWTLALRYAAAEEEPFDTRWAAATAVNEIVPSLNKLDTDLARQHLQEIVLIIYDLTNDDDDEVRELASQAVQRIVGTSQPYVPPVAGLQLLRWLLRRSRGSKELFAVAMARLVPRDQHSSAFAPVNPLLESSRAQEDVLFAEERQNLFKDPTREARIWSHMLQCLSMDVIDADTLFALYQWALTSIKSLEIKAQSSHDGPLGWSRSPDVFTAGLQVFYSAECLLMWSRRGGGRKGHSAVLRAHLIRLLQVGMERDMHPMWLGEMEKILVRDVRLGVLKVGGVVMASTDRLESGA